MRIRLSSTCILDMAIIADGLDGLSKETILSEPPTSTPTKTCSRSDILKQLQQSSEGLSHLSTQWPNYASNYDTNVLEIFKLIQVM